MLDDYGAVRAWVRNEYTYGKMVVVARIAEQFFGGDKDEALSCVEALKKSGDLIQIPFGSLEILTVSKEAPSSGPEERVTEVERSKAQEAWSAIIAHPAAQQLGILLTDPMGFISAFGTRKETIAQAAKTRGIKSSDFINLILKHVKTIAAEAGTLALQYADAGSNNGKAETKHVSVLFPALLGERAEQLDPSVVGMFAQAGLLTGSNITARVRMHQDTVRLALVSAGIITEEDVIGTQATKMQQQGIGWLAICSEVALLLSQRKRKEQQSRPAGLQNGSSGATSQSVSYGAVNLRKVISGALRGCWNAIKESDVDQVLGRINVRKAEDLCAYIGRSDLETVVESFNLDGKPLGSALREAYPALKLCADAIANNHDRLVDDRVAWRQIAPCREIKERHIAHPGHLVAWFEVALDLAKNDVSGALKRMTRDLALQRLIVVNILSFQKHALELQTDQDLRWNITGEPLPPIGERAPHFESVSEEKQPHASDKGGIAPMPKFTQEAQAVASMSQEDEGKRDATTWKGLSSIPCVQVLGFSSSDELVAVVRTAGGVTPAVRQRSRGGTAVPYAVVSVRKYLEHNKIQFPDELAGKPTGSTWEAVCATKSYQRNLKNDFPTPESLKLAVSAAGGDHSSVLRTHGVVSGHFIRLVESFLAADGDVPTAGNDLSEEAEDSHVSKSGRVIVKRFSSPQEASEHVRASSVWDKLLQGGMENDLSAFLNSIDQKGSARAAVRSFGVMQPGKFCVLVEKNLDILREYTDPSEEDADHDRASGHSEELGVAAPARADNEDASSVSDIQKDQVIASETSHVSLDTESDLASSGNTGVSEDVASTEARDVAGTVCSDEQDGMENAQPEGADSDDPTPVQKPEPNPTASSELIPTNGSPVDHAKAIMQMALSAGEQGPGALIPSSVALALRASMARALIGMFIAQVTTVLPYVEMVERVLRDADIAPLLQQSAEDKVLYEVSALGVRAGNLLMQREEMART